MTRPAPTLPKHIQDTNSLRELYEYLAKYATTPNEMVEMCSQLQSFVPILTLEERVLRDLEEMNIPLGVQPPAPPPPPPSAPRPRIPRAFQRGRGKPKVHTTCPEHWVALWQVCEVAKISRSEAQAILAQHGLDGDEWLRLCVSDDSYDGDRTVWMVDPEAIIQCGIQGFEVKQP